MIYNVVFYSWGMFYLGDRGRGSLRSILSNKIALASVLALVMYFLQIKIPEPLYSTFNGIGALTMPLSMIIIGCSLADSGICKILWDRTLYLPTVLRMAVMPAARRTTRRISWCRPCWPCWLPCPPGSSWWGCRLGTQSASFHSLFEKIKEGITTW